MRCNQKRDVSIFTTKRLHSVKKKNRKEMNIIKSADDGEKSTVRES